MLQKSGWTKDIDLFFQWLSALPFSGGGFNDVAAAEGLAEALMMFSSLKNADGQRHCILVAASNPYPLPRRVYYPAMLNLEQSDNEAHTSLRLADAETVARAFPQGKCDRQAAAPPVDTSKNPNFLVLISENFSEACAAFSHTEMESLAPNQTLVEMDMSSVPPVSGPAATSNPSVMNQQPISAGTIPLGRNNSAEANMSLSQQQTLATVPSAPSGYVEFWEGNLCMVRGGQPEHISKLQGYKKSSASESPAANLPQTLQIHPKHCKFTALCSKIICFNKLDSAPLERQIF
ncbi:mediator of RNA polymerase II transcription subunit 25 isoform X3 [Solanum tuberosum]|uniref:mediator of RNA polymerase II transcription subunit 25 isoform X3 n=1 Tax=Solanum tuberosum TaxID=4113 RepID=UPI00073A0F28|nr:PREDICTED: mediator of RNA polymerase II transcription subunit 25 isoform X3 [Solanum tuberosum]